jgi:hypothetical protein
VNSLSLNAATSSPSFIKDQPTAEENSANNQDLCRAIFDDLMDRDILGFLLSTAHMHKYLALYATYVEPRFAAAVQRSTKNPDVVDCLHQAILKMFAGIYIAEAAMKDRSEMLAALERKYETLALELGASEVHFEAPLHQLESVELAWKYRNACALGRLANPL